MTKKNNIFLYQSDVRGNLFPLLPLSIKYKNKSNDYYALIDSGATISMFKADVADYLGINIEKGQEIIMRSINGLLRGYLHIVKIFVGRKQFPCKIIFSRDQETSFNILGRNSFFEKFKITFDEAKKSVTLE